MQDIKRTYVVHNWEKGRIRAWHGHEKAWTGMHVIHGAAKLVACPIGDDSEKKSLTAVLSDKNPCLFNVNF
jgi:dTDP-4-dehydrorhamnose 3,5-epimerase-like enzyme